MTSLGQVLAAAPWVAQGWRLLPGPWRIPMLIGGAVLWLWSRQRESATG